MNFRPQLPLPASKLQCMRSRDAIRLSWLCERCARLFCFETSGMFRFRSAQPRCWYKRLWLRSSSAPFSTCCAITERTARDLSGWRVVDAQATVQVGMGPEWLLKLSFGLNYSNADQFYIQIRESRGRKQLQATTSTSKSGCLIRERPEKGSGRLSSVRYSRKHATNPSRASLQLPHHNWSSADDTNCSEHVVGTAPPTRISHRPRTSLHHHPHPHDNS